MTITDSRARPIEQRSDLNKRDVSRLPGPPWYTAVGNTLSFLRHALDFSVEMRERFGDVVSVPTLMGRVTLIFHADGVRHILQENHRNYNKDIPDYRIISLILGKGLLTNDGASWLQQRRLIQPAFHRDLVAALGPIMTDTMLASIERNKGKDHTVGKEYGKAAEQALDDFFGGGDKK